LDDVLSIEEGKTNDTRLYRCLDRILPHTEKCLDLLFFAKIMNKASCLNLLSNAVPVWLVSRASGG
jgi:hypothetical protein